MNIQPLGTIIIKRNGDDANARPVEVLHRAWSHPSRVAEGAPEFIDHIATYKGQGNYLIEGVTDHAHVAAIARAIHGSHPVAGHSHHAHGIPAFTLEGVQHGVEGDTARIQLAGSGELASYIIPAPPLWLIEREIRRGWEILKAITTAGAQFAAQAIMNKSGTTFFDNADAYLGVGDSTTAFSASQTDLQAASNKTRKAMDATYPSYSGGVLTLQATFATTDANYAWQEWGVFNGSSGGTMLSRKVESLGTKTSAQSWQFQVALTFAAA